MIIEMHLRISELFKILWNTNSGIVLNYSSDQLLAYLGSSVQVGHSTQQNIIPL
jgi:hypothetical protein